MVSFRGYPNRVTVETLRDERLFVNVPADKTSSGPEKHFDRQLIGLRVLDAESRRIGKVAEMLYLPAQDCLVVETSSRRRLVPFVPALMTWADLTAGEVQFTGAGGLLGESE